MTKKKLCRKTCTYVGCVNLVVKDFVVCVLDHSNSSPPHTHTHTVDAWLITTVPRTHKVLKHENIYEHTGVRVQFKHTD